MRKLTIILLVSIICLCALAQNKKGLEINQYNSRGLKEGLWIDTLNQMIYEVYYKNGKQSGLFKQCMIVNGSSRLTILGEYNNGEEIGVWYYFETTGHLLFITKDYSVNKDSVISEATGEKYVPENKCYSISYYANGDIESEGSILWSEGDCPESDTAIRYGEWRFYDRSGKIEKIKKFCPRFNSF